MRSYRRYRRRPRHEQGYTYDRDGQRRTTGQRGLAMAPRTVRLLAIGMVLFVLVAILLHLTK